MIHKMKLYQSPFEKVKNGTKSIEIRLNDEKRQLLNVGDIISFTNTSTGEVVDTEIIALHKFKNFEQLYNSFDKEILGYLKDEKSSPEDMLEYYSKENIEKYGALGIEVKLKS